jgi:hypothetical protein
MLMKNPVPTLLLPVWVGEFMETWKSKNKKAGRD